MDAEQARQQIKNHQAASESHTGPKRQQHLEAIRNLREKYSVPEPAIVKAIPVTDFDRVRARLEPHAVSKPDWIDTQRLS